jgi:hypothetical protein
MGRTARAALAAVPALLAVSCLLAAPLDKLTGDAGAPAAEGGAGDAVGASDTGLASEAGGEAGGDDGGATDAPGDTAPATDAPVEAATEAGNSVYAAAVFADTPLAYWRLDETSGTVCHDATGHGNDAAIVGTVTLGVAGALAHDPDPAAQFDGAGGRLDVGDKFDFAGLAPATIELWVKPDVIDNAYRHIETKMLYTDAGQPDFGMYMYVHAGNTLGFERWANNATDIGLGTTQVTAGAWWHIVGTFDGSAMNLYVNGVLVQGGPTAISLVPNGVHLLWGQSFQGALDELALYDHALSAARVQAHWQAAQ